MNDKHATVKAHITNGAGARPSDGPPKTAEQIRVELAEAWGEMGAAWGVTPAIARVQAYLMARQEPLTEREVRDGLIYGFKRSFFPGTYLEKRTYVRQVIDFADRVLSAGPPRPS